MLAQIQSIVSQKLLKTITSALSVLLVINYL